MFEIGAVSVVCVSDVLGVCALHVFAWLTGLLVCVSTVLCVRAHLACVHLPAGLTTVGLLLLDGPCLPIHAPMGAGEQHPASLGHRAALLLHTPTAGTGVACCIV